MLILSRQKQESITIAGNIVMTVLEIQGNKVKLGFSAPPDVKILRTEIIGLEKKGETADGTKMNLVGAEATAAAASA